MAGQDIDAHEKTYSGFMSMLKIGTIISFVIAMLVVLLIAN